MDRRTTRTSRLLAATAALALAGGVATAAPAAADHAGDATIHPGVQTLTAGGQCTANFVFRNASGTYIGQAAHCSGTGGQTETDGCLAGSLPLGTEVTVTGASRPGVMVYNSWLAMQDLGETDPNACAFNDFALVQLHPDDEDRVSPEIPVLGGPTGINTEGTSFGDSVYSYGNSSLRAGISQLSPKEGISVGTSGEGWTHSVYTLSPGVPGDSGSAFVDADGRALGVLSTLALAPLPASNGVSDLNKVLDYANDYLAEDVELVTGGAATGPLVVLRGLLG